MILRHHPHIDQNLLLNFSVLCHQHPWKKIQVSREDCRRRRMIKFTDLTGVCVDRRDCQQIQGADKTLLVLGAHSLNLPVQIESRRL